MTGLALDRLVVDNFDIWTGAIERKSSTGRGGAKRVSHYGIERLRALILDLAVRGKLVPQDAGDEPATELLKQMKAERAALIKAKKIGKGKAFPTVSEAPPFSIPDNWVWTQISDVGHDWGQQEPTSDFTYIDVGSIDRRAGIVQGPNVLGPKNAPSRARKVVRKGTIIYSTVRPYLLNIAIVDQDFDPEPIASTAFAVINPFSGVEADFIYRYLRSPAFVRYVELCQTGIAYPAVNDRQFFAAWCPLPPAAEQRRIAAKVDELMALCNALERETADAIAAHQALVETLLATLVNSANAADLTSNWARLKSHFDTLFTTESSIDALKQTILDLAVRGKLVEQTEGEGAAPTLKIICAERAEMAAARVIRVKSPPAKASSTDLPFVLPDSWIWCRLGELGGLENGDRGRDYPNKSALKPSGVPFVNAGHLQNGLVDQTRMTFITEEHYQKLGGGKFRDGDILYCLRGSLGKSAIVVGIERGAIASSLVIIRLASSFLRKFMMVYLGSQLASEMIRRYDNGTAQPNLSSANLERFLVPLPPLAEQQRIVAKVDELMALCDALKARLIDAATTQGHLADAIVERAAA